MNDLAESDRRRDGQELRALEAAHQRLCHERDRLRDARGLFARGLGPLPASAGISTALVGTLGSGLHMGFVWAAVGMLGVLVACGIAYDSKKAYRHLYADHLRRLREDQRESDALVLEGGIVPEPTEWYRVAIELERALIGPPLQRNRWRMPWAPVETLQDGLDSERTGLRAVQLLWLVVIVLLVLAKLG